MALGQTSTPIHVNSAALKAAAEQENLVIKGESGTHIRPSAVPDAESASLLLSSLKGCVVVLPPSARFSSAAVKHVDRCVLILGTAVAGPVHLTDVTNSVLVFGCHQMRMHDARNVSLYLHCRSRPIIEDSESIRFHEFGDSQGNMWDQVDDFKWLRSEKSPHWSAEQRGAGCEARWKEIGAKEVGELEVAKVLAELLPKT